MHVSCKCLRVCCIKYLVRNFVHLETWKLASGLSFEEVGNRNNDPIFHKLFRT